MNLNHCFSLVLLFCSHFCNAQLFDNFSDGEILNNPGWSGTTEKFEVLSGDSLHLNDSVAGEAYLSTSSQAIYNASWEFYVNLGFNPSSSNFCKVYLTSNNENLSEDLNGYFVKIGGTADEISLFRQDQDVEVKIIDGIDKVTDLSKVQMRIKVERDGQGNWTLKRAISKKGGFISEGQALDLRYETSSYFGFFCQYTITRADKFYFDDFIVLGEQSPDTKAPILDSLIVESNNSLTLTFSEEIDKISAEVLGNYMVDIGIGEPSQALLDAERPNRVKLVFDRQFVSGITLVISIKNISDLAGNFMNVQQRTFVFFIPELAEPNDIVINEIFADVSPTVALPEAEFIEIFNTSKKVFNLNGWSLSDVSGQTKLTSYFIQPKAYLIICDERDSTKFKMFGEVMTIPSFPSLNDSGDALELRDEKGNTIDKLRYDRSWYQDSQRNDGGYSLEKIRPTSLCQGSFNWRASLDESGGTPGTVNSVFNGDPDLSGPVFISAMALAQDSIKLVFDESIDASSLSNAQFIVKPEIKISAISRDTINTSFLYLILSESLNASISYELTVDGIFDCAGNKIREENNNQIFVLTEPASKGDILISEILFNARAGGFDFVELFNNSKKYINLKSWHLANLGTNDSIDQVKVVTNSDLIIGPREYLAFTENPVILKSEYPLGNEERFVETDLPTFPDEEGHVLLLNPEDSILDQFHYNEDLHFSIIRETDGVSLERLSFALETKESSNWKSASSTVGYATPGYKNSQSATESTAMFEVSISPKTFSPDNDGFDDFAQINYNFQETGNVANVIIYDVNGREVKRVADQQLIGRQGFFIWDGTNSNNLKAGIGYYVIVFRTFNSNGEENEVKKTVVLATRL